MRDELLGYVGVGLCGAALAIATYLVTRVPVAVASKLGLRGLKRQQALASGGVFAAIEPIVRFVASLIAPLPLAGLRRRVEVRLTQAGDLLGLTADELLALSFLSGLGLLGFGLLFGDVIGDSAPVLCFVAVIGASLPHLRIGGEIQSRQRHVDRALPMAIDLAALCMGAGLDFPGALRQITEKALSPDEPLHEELGRILRLLDLGRSRKDALLSFAERVPTEAVRDFVSAVVQAEEKGNPLAQVLRVQARMLRMRRSVDAEQAASRAGVMMMIPLLFIFGSIMLILMGPFILNGMTSGF